MSLRLAPLHNFHTYLCSLNYYEDFKEEFFNPEVEKEPKPQNTLTEAEELEEVPLTFENAEKYIRIWRSLFYVEARSQIKREEHAREDTADIFLLKAVDVTEVEGFKVFQMLLKDTSNNTYRSNDIILICNQSPETNHLQHLIGIIHFTQGAEIRAKTIINPESMDERTQSIVPLLIGNSEWHVQKLCNMATLNREYQALQSISDLNLKEILLNPNENLPSKYSYFDIPDQLNKKMQETYNFSQYNAIKECLKREGITLIQGPPGTGKTTTILGVLSVLLNSRNKIDKYREAKNSEKNVPSGTSFTEQEKQKCFRKAMPWLYDDDFVDWQDDTENNPFNTADSYKERRVLLPPIRDETTIKPERILICAPSNAAIDEIIRKLSSSGLFDADGNTYVPNLVRIGPNYHPSLKQFALEFLVAKEKEANATRDTKNIQNDIIRRIQIVCSTLSITGSDLLTSNLPTFDTVVIDEAAQAVEIATLIPLKYDCKRLILIGDPQQLPATVFSRKSQTMKYDQSLFYRLQSGGYPVHLLKVQYRMHPQISWFISKAFYKSKLLDFENIMKLIGEPEYYNCKGLQPVTFFNVEGQEAFVNNTYQNEIEAEFVIKCYEFLRTSLPKFDKNKLGIITPYNGQAVLIRELIKKLENTLFCEVEVNSVDSFQGREKDIVIFSTVRSSYEGIEEEAKPSIGFLKDKRRMNVGLSRARIGLIVVGDVERLRKAKSGDKWKFLIDYSTKKKRCFNTGSEPFDDYFSAFQSNPDNFVMKQIPKPVKETPEPVKE